MKAVHKRQITEKQGKVFTAIYYVAVCVILLCCTVSFFVFPNRDSAAGNGEEYPCIWQDGEESTESYAVACRNFFAVDENGDILLHRGEREGRISSRRLQNAHSVLKTAPLAELLTFDFHDLNAIERAALACEFSGMVYYSEGDAFRYTQNGLVRTEQIQTETLALVTSSLPVSLIRNTKAEEVWIYPQTIIKPTMFVGSQVERLIVQEPYFVHDRVLYLKTASGIRCVAALPALKTAVIEGNDYADEGALLACKQLEELTVSFAGSDRDANSTLYCGEVGHLFSENDGYNIPRSLKKITVTGGQLVSHAFYACCRVEEINVCALDSKEIDEYAFADCDGLKVLHTPRGGVVLPEGEFLKQRAPCGCLIYTRCEP